MESNNELMHYGVLGMKWGVRKARKTSGKRLGFFKKKTKASTQPQTSKKKTKVSTKPQKSKKKSVKDMSDDELRKAINRLEMEKRYKDLSPKQVSKGKEFVSGFINKAVIPAVNEAGKNLARDYIMKVGKKKMGLDIPKDAEQAAYDYMSKKVKQWNTEKMYMKLKEERKQSVKKETSNVSKDTESKTEKEPEKEYKKKKSKNNNNTYAIAPLNTPRFF